MPMLRYQELNLLQMLDVLRGATLAHLALSDGAHLADERKSKIGKLEK